MLEFGSPGWLWGLALIPALWFFARQHQILPAGKARCLVFVTRALIVSAVVLALADTRWNTTHKETAVLVLVDNSSSIQTDGLLQAQQFIDAAKEAGGGHRLAIATQFPTPNLWKSFDMPDGSAPLSPVSTVQTDMADFLDWSGLEMHPAAPTRIVLLTDGLVSDEAEFLHSIYRIRKHGTPVDIVKLNPDRGEEVELGEVTLHSRMEPGRPFDLPVVVRSTITQDATLRVFQNDLLIREQNETITQGESIISLQALVPESGASKWRVEITAPADTKFENNAIVHFAAATGATSVLMIDPDPYTLAPAARAAEQSGMEVEIRRPGDFPASLDGLAGFDVVVLSDTPAAALGDASMSILSEWVTSAGGGLLVTGGPNAFAAGGYFGTPLAELIPVITDYVDQAELSVAAVYVSLDRSGSMSAPVAGTTKMALANAGAVRAMELLDHTDLFGVAAVDTEVHPVLPLAPVTDRAAATRIIQSITAGGGGIYVFTALMAAYRELAAVNARLKHLILFSDAADAEEQVAPAGSGVLASSLDVASAMLAARMTVSVVALGVEADKDTSFLRALAAHGGGRFYLTSDATTLPRIFAEETLRATQNSLIEEPFLPVTGVDSADIAGIDWPTAPDLFGYNAVQSRSTAPPSLLTESGTPLQASWRQGLGRVTAFTSDINGRWSTDWLDWPGFAQWFVQTLRMLVPPSNPGDIIVTPTARGTQLTVKIEASNPDGSPRAELQPQVSTSDGRSPGTSSIAMPVGPGEYAVTLDSSIMDTALISVMVDEEPVLAAWNRPAVTESWVLRNSDALLQKAVTYGGGMLNPSPEEVFRDTGRVFTAPESMTSWLITLAIILWPIDIWLRRRRWDIHA